MISTAEVGISPEAHTGLDSYDYVAPPGAFDAVRLTLIREELPLRYQQLAREVRPKPGEGQVFDLVLKAERGKPVTLRVEGLEQFTSWEVYLVDERLSKFYNLRTQPALQLVPLQAVSGYRLLIGSTDFVEEKRIESVPEVFRLLPNYPNPFNQETKIEYALPQAEYVRLIVYDALGREVARLVDRQEPAGLHSVTWPAQGAASGFYFYRIEAGSHVETRTMLLLR